MKSALLFLLVLVLPFSLNAQVIWNMGTASPGNANPSSGTPVTNLTVSAISTGNSNLSTFLINNVVSNGYTGASGSYNAAAIARTGSFSLLNSAYYEFTLTPATGYQVVISTISFGSRSTKTGPVKFNIRTSQDAYAGAVAGGLMTANSIWMRKDISNLGLISNSAGGPLTIRIYGYDGIGTTPTSAANWRIDDLTVGLTVRLTPGSCTGTPATATVVSSEGNTLCSDNAATTLSLTTDYSNFSNITYQWQQSVSGGAFQNINGASNPTFTTPDVLTQNTDYRALITCIATSNTVTTTALSLIINASPVLTAAPAAQAGCVGGSAVFSVAATGTGLTYNWYRLNSAGATLLSNGSNISGATSPAVTLSGLTASDAAYTYYAVIQSAGGCQKPTVDVALSINTPVTITQPPLPLTVNTGSPATFSVTATGDIVGYQWRKKGITIPGATASSYTIPVVTAADTGAYSVLITGAASCGNVLSANAALTLSAPLPVGMTSFSGMRTAGGVVLTWAAGDVAMLSGYRIERSADGKNFEHAGRQDIVPLRQIYQWPDATAPATTAFYRLAAEGQNGVPDSYSPVIKIAAASGQPALFIRPNPAGLRLEIAGGSGLCQFSITSVSGREVQQGKISLDNHPSLDLSGLQPGFYVLRITGYGLLPFMRQ